MDPQFFDKIPSALWDLVFQLDLKITTENQNSNIIDLLHRTTLLGGKRFRPLLTFLMADFFCLAPQESIPYARAIELVHAASLAHDDVIDEATTRRGNDSINIAASNKKAVLAGDYLLADVIVDLCRLGNIRLVSEMSMVIKDLSDGEWLQLDGQRPENFSWEYIEKVAEKKTASVMSWCCVAPAILAKAEDQVVEDCRSFGKELGLAFQFIDDTLDFQSVSGKDTFQDLKNGVLNSVVFEFLKERLSLKGDHVLPSYNFQSLMALDSPELILAVERVRERAKERLELAKELLQNIFRTYPFADVERAEKGLHTLTFVLEYLYQRRK